MLCLAQDTAWFLIHTRDFSKCLLNQKNKKMEKERTKGRKEGKQRGKGADGQFVAGEC